MVNWVFDDPIRFRTMTACPITVIKENLDMESGRFPVANFFWFWRWAEGGWDTTGTQSWHCYSIDDRPSKYAYNIGVWTDPSWWAGWDHNPYGNPNLFDLIPPQVLEDCRNDKALLVIDNLNEGFQSDDLYAFWHSSCSKHSLDPNNIVFLTSNLLDEEGYLEWAAANHVNRLIHVIAFCHLQYQQISCLKHDYRDITWEDHAVVKSTNGRSIKLFNCLNRVRRPHREFLMLRFIEADLHKHGLISHDRLEHHNWIDYGVDPEVIKHAENILPLVIDDSDFGNNKAMQMTPDIYLRSWVSVITETHAFDDRHSLFISEKPWKPVCALQPFMVLGHRNTLEAIRNMGYKTFSGLIDESYDDLPFIERTTAIINNLRRISVIRDKWGWLQECREILEHNKKVFVNQEIFKHPAMLRFLEIYHKLGTR